MDALRTRGYMKLTFRPQLARESNSGARVSKSSSASSQGKLWQTTTGKTQGDTCHEKVVVDTPETGTRQAPEQHRGGDDREGQREELLRRVIEKTTPQTFYFNDISIYFFVSIRG